VCLAVFTYIFQYLLDRRLPDPSSFFHEGQTLVAKVTEVDRTKNRFLVSIRSSDCYHGDSEIGVQLLSDYLTEYRDAIKRLKKVEGW
jgi:gamma-glutamylcysteine synthetase